MAVGTWREDSKEQEELNKNRRLMIIRKAADRRRDRQRSIGSEAVLNGKPVKWAGPDLAWQSPETFKKLETEGYGGDVDYLRNGGWQANKINTAIGEAAQNLKPIGDQYGKFKRGNPLAAWYLESVGQGVGWGLEQLERPVTATSRALNIHPFFGNLAIETAAELATPFVSTTAIKHLPKVIKGVNNLGNVIDTARYRDLTRGIALSKQPSLSLYSGLPLPEDLPKLPDLSGLPGKPKPKISKRVLEAQRLLDEIPTNGNGHVKKKDNTSTKVRNRNNPDLSIFKPKTGKGISDAITPEGVEGIYGVTVNRKQIDHPHQGHLSGDVDLHHKVGKDIRFDFTTQARKLDPKGQAALDDIDVEYGLQSGSGADALTPYNKIPHNRTHNSERRFLDTKDSFMSGNEPSGRFLHELRNDIAGASSLKELKKLYRDYIERSVLPFNKNADHFQRAFEKAGTPKRMTEAELKNYAKLQKAQEEALHDLKIERAMELLDFTAE